MMFEAKKRNLKVKPSYIKKTDIKLSKEDIRRTPKISDGGFIWAG